MSSTYGEHLKLSIFGQSHAPAIGMTLDGVPAGQAIDLDELQRFLDRRAPGRAEYATPRKEADRPEFLSGLVGNVTCGAPLAAMSNSGSGNQGVTCTAPVAAAGRRMGRSHEEIVRAAAAANLLTVFLKTTGRKSFMLYIPMVVMFCVTMTALVESAYALIIKIASGNWSFLIEGLQFVLAIALMVLAISIVYYCGKELVHADNKTAHHDAQPTATH